jgi:hypothetical protein
VIQFIWKASRGYRFTPWRSPYLRWRIETYSGLHAEHIDFKEFWTFVWRNRREMFRFLRWVGRMSQ